MALLEFAGSVQALDTHGTPLPKAQQIIYLAGTDTLAPLYGDAKVKFTVANPLKADHAGKFPTAYIMPGRYRAELRDVNGDPVSVSDDFLILPDGDTGVAHEFETVSDLLDEQRLTYTVADVNFVALPGKIISVPGSGFSYRIEDQTATDNHIETSGGVKLTVLPGPNGEYNLAAFGAALDGVTDDAPALRAAIDAVKDGGVVDAPVTLRVPEGKTVTLNTICAVDEGSIRLVGDGAFMRFGTDYAIDICTSEYLQSIHLGNFSFVLEGFICSAAAGVTCIRNNGYRKLWIDNIYCLGGATFLETEGAFAGSGMRRCRIQSTTGTTVKIKQRNNNWTFDNCAITGAGAPAVHLSTVDGELKGIQWYGRNDIEGCAGGILVEGQTSILGMDSLWFENNTVFNIRIDNTAGTYNKDAISITRCNFTSAGADVEIGTDPSGTYITGVTVYGNEFSHSDLVFVEGGRLRNSTLGANAFNAGSSYTMPANSPLLAGGIDLPLYQAMPLFSTAPAVPWGTPDTKGVVGEIRWEAGLLWIKTDLGWVQTQLGQQGGGNVAGLTPGTATPDVTGHYWLRTTNPGTTLVTDFQNGRAGQEIKLIGLDGGNTTIKHGGTIRLAGGADFTLGDNDVLSLVCRDGSTWAETGRSNNG
ncbi:MAG: hypothetical protein AAF307_01505 [Pseudomonadota bacterium]